MEDKQKHFQTRDERLAFALINAGCQLAPQYQGGPAENIYTPADMRSKGMLKPGSASIAEFQVAVTKAAQTKRKGIVTYYIVKDAVFERAIKAWDDMAAEFEAAKSEGRQPTIPKIDEIAAMQVAYMLRMNSAAMREIPFVRTPILSTLEGATAQVPIANKNRDIARGGVNEANAPGSREVTTASGGAWTLGTPDWKLKELGIL